MQSTQSPKPSDDPCDDVVVAPDVVRVVPSDEGLSDLLRHVARYRSDTQTRAAADFNSASMAPPVDPMFRPTSANEVRSSGDRRSVAAQLVRALAALLLAAGISLTAIAWKSYGEVAKNTIAMLTTQFVVASSQREEPAIAAQSASPVVQADAPNAASPQPAAPTQTAPSTVAPSADSSSDSSQLPQSAAHDLAALRQEVEELKASMEQLKASQQQIRDDVAKASEQNQRPQISAPPPRLATPQTRKPIRSFSPPHAAATTQVSPQATAPYQATAHYYAPRQPEPQSQSTAEPSTNTELSPVPRPPMPVR